MTYEKLQKLAKKKEYIIIPRHYVREVFSDIQDGEKLVAHLRTVKHYLVERKKLFYLLLVSVFINFGLLVKLIFMWS